MGDWLGRDASAQARPDRPQRSHSRNWRRAATSLGVAPGRRDGTLRPGGRLYIVRLIPPPFCNRTAALVVDALVISPSLADRGLRHARGRPPSVTSLVVACLNMLTWEEPRMDKTSGAGGSKPPSRREEHIADTRNGLLEAARELFTVNGYSATSLEDIARLARVSRLGVYHHFGSKEALFRAVLEEVESGFIERLAATPIPGDDVWEEITNGCQAFLDVALEPEVQQIVLLDGPAVLGWEAWREIEERFGFGLLRQFLAQAIDDGFLPRQPVDPIVHLLSGALNEAASYIAHAPDRQRARTEMGAALTGVLGRLGQRPPASGHVVLDLDADDDAAPDPAAMQEASAVTK